MDLTPSFELHWHLRAERTSTEKSDNVKGNDCVKFKNSIHELPPSLHRLEYFSVLIPKYYLLYKSYDGRSSIRMLRIQLTSLQLSDTVRTTAYFPRRIYLKQWASSFKTSRHIACIGVVDFAQLGLQWRRLEAVRKMVSSKNLALTGRLRPASPTLKVSCTYFTNATMHLPS